MTNQGKLLTKLNPRYVRIFNSLPWLGIEFYASKISMSFYLFMSVLCAKISSVYKPLKNTSNRGDPKHKCVCECLCEREKKFQSITEMLILNRVHSR